MVSMYITLAISFISSFLSRIASDKKYKAISIWFILITATAIIIFAGFRDGSIGDTGMYMHSYRRYVSNPEYIEFERDAGFSLLNLLLINISSDPQILVIVTALITNLLNIIVMYKYRNYLELQIYVYITSGYLTVTMNGMRQCLAASILFIATKFIIEGNFKKYLIFVLISATFHESALIMIPIYFIVRQEAWSKTMFIIIGLSIIGMASYSVLSPIFFKALEQTQYGHYSEFNEGGSSVIRVVVSVVPVFLAYIKREELKKKWSNSNIFINMALINTIIIAFGVVNWIFNRVSLYTQLYNMILFPFIIANCFKGKERRLLYFGFILCYFIFFYREQVIGMNMNYPSVINYRELFFGY